MDKIALKFNIYKPFGNLIRPKHVYIFVRDIDNKTLLGSKPRFYPAKLYRFLGGGLDDLDYKSAAIKEMKEETYVETLNKDYIDVVKFDINAIDIDKKEYEVEYYIVLYIPKIENARAGDDVEEIVHLTEEQYFENIKNWYNVPKGTFISDNETNTRFDWYDYGQIYGKVHELSYKIVMEKLT